MCGFMMSDNFIRPIYGLALDLIVYILTNYIIVLYLNKAHYYMREMSVLIFLNCRIGGVYF